jgi:hypothetical protein
MSPKIFDLRALDMGSAYDWTQCGPVGHGDVILARDGVAVMCQAWPVMVVGSSAVFHRLAPGQAWDNLAMDLLPGERAALADGVLAACRPLDELAALAELTVSHHHLDLDELDLDLDLDEPAGPSPDQLAAVAAYAARHGRTWRADLAAAWSTGRDTAEPDGHLLRQVRNTYGPTWLATVTLADLAAAGAAA